MHGRPLKRLPRSFFTSNERIRRALGRPLADRRVAHRGSRPSEVLLRQSPRDDVEEGPCLDGQDSLVGRTLLRGAEGQVVLYHFEGRS